MNRGKEWCLNDQKDLEDYKQFNNRILFLLLIFMIFVVVSSKASGGEPTFLGNQLKTVLSGSMEPTFKTGSIIAVTPVSETARLKVKDIITFVKQEKSS